MSLLSCLSVRSKQRENLDLVSSDYQAKMMIYTEAFAAALAILPLLAFGQSTTLLTYGSLPKIAGDGTAVRSDGKYVCTSEGITAYFIPYGATVSNLFIKDVHGVPRDIVLGSAHTSHFQETFY